MVNVKVNYIMTKMNNYLLLSEETSMRRKVEDEPSELPVNSMKHSEPKVDNLCSPTKDFSLASETETGASSGSRIVASEESSSADCLVNLEINNPGKPLVRSKELVPPYQLSADHRISYIASTSYQDQPSSDAVAANVGSNGDLVNDVDIKEKDESPVFAEGSLHQMGNKMEVGEAYFMLMRWLLDFGSDLLHDGVGSDSGYIGSRSRNQGGNGWRRHSRSEPGHVVSESEDGNSYYHGKNAFLVF
ncbi:hypothetical protein RHSIM_Rhsim01G0126500 [Rhododendron simsii]|uniref:Uncharacterized protein n=1 Tax=Rhododendron simsii TaxID=118357 RepID=A0A834HKD0_RHOSS|nr:hypothetical protein RHSIM_Rhsim01G0126500 [Rhododendron simsii]